MSRSLCHWTPRIWGQTLNTSSTMHDIKTSSFIKDQWKQLTIWNSHLSPTSFQTSTRQTLTCLPRLSKQTQDKLLPVSHVFPNKHKTNSYLSPTSFQTNTRQSVRADGMAVITKHVMTSTTAFVWAFDNENKIVWVDVCRLFWSTIHASDRDTGNPLLIVGYPGTSR